MAHKISKRKKEQLKIIKSQIGDHRYQKLVDALLNKPNESMGLDAHMADTLEQKICYLDLEEILMIGSDYDRADSNDDINIQFSINRFNGEHGTTIFAVSDEASEHNVMFKFDNSTEKLTIITCKGNYGIGILRKYLLAKTVGLIS